METRVSGWMMVGAIRMQVKLSSRMDVKIVIARFIRVRSQASPETNRVGAKMVSGSAKKTSSLPFSKKLETANPMTMKTARAIGPSAK